MQCPAAVYCHVARGGYSSNSKDYVAVSELHVLDSTSAGFHYKGTGIVFQTKAEDLPQSCNQCHPLTWRNPGSLLLRAFLDLNCVCSACPESPQASPFLLDAEELFQFHQNHHYHKSKQKLLHCLLTIAWKQKLLHQLETQKPFC